MTHAAFKSGFKQSESAGCWRAEQVVRRLPAARRRTARRLVVKTPHRRRPDVRNIAAHVNASDPFVPWGLKLFQLHSREEVWGRTYTVQYIIGGR